MEEAPQTMDFAEATEFLSFYDWKELFLETRGLDKPDGRQLFQYRVSDNEFGLLEDFLRSKIAALLRNNDFQYICTRPGFADLFVMYGAEWWRRRYDGSGFSWEPILSDLNADTIEWHQHDRSECVRRGLEGWQLPLYQTGGFRFLGAVARQGGLPMRLLAEARGRIGHAISLVLRQAKTNSVSKSELQGWAESVQTILPKSYRQAVIFNLLADIAWTVLDLKQRASLSSGQDAITQLNRSIPDWRESFPLPVNDNHARSLIEQLVREAATIKVQRQKVALPVEHALVHDEDGMWQLRSNIDLPDTIDSNQLAALFDANEDDLPRTAQLSLTVGGLVRETSIRKTAGHDKFRVLRQPWEISGAPATQEHIFKLTAPDGRAWSCTAHRGSALNEGLPWIFSAEEGAMSFLRQGGGSVAESEAYVVTPSPWRIIAQPGAETSLTGEVCNQKLSVHKAKGTISVSDTDGNEFRIRTGNAAATRETYEWQGDRLWFAFADPPIAFRGEPLLYSIDEDGNRRRLQGDTRCNVIAAPLSRLRFGPVYLQYPATGEIKQRTRMLLLPPEAKLEFEPNNPTSGSIALKGWKTSSARVITTGVSSTCASFEDNLVLNLEVAPEARTPDQVDVEVHWKHTTAPAHLSLPFPARGVRGFRGDGKEICSGERIAVRQLLGSRLVIVGISDASRKVLRLRTSNQDIYRRYALRSSSGSMTTEIRISDYRSEIEQLLTIDDNPDSTVQLSIELNGREAYSLEITPHEAWPQRNESTIHIGFATETEEASSEENNAQVLAIRMESPGEEPVQLTEVECDDPGCRSWDFTPNLQQPGCWLIYPARGSKITFRPTLWNVIGEVNGSNEYVNAIATRQGLDSLIEELASNFSHPNWVEVEQLAEQTGHLPLATFDVWRKFGRSSKGMAALALRLGSLKTEFLYRFAQELPFSWETVAWEDWRSAARLAECYSKELFPEDTYKAVFDSFFKSRIDSFSAEFGALFYVLGILSADYFEDSRNDVSRLKVGGQMASGWLFQGENSLLMKLRRAHSGDDEEWPCSFKELVSASRNDSAITKYMCSERFGFQDSVINLPLVVASQLVLNRTADWFSDAKMIHALRTHQAFDPDWFDEAFNQTIARCLADGLLGH